MALIGRIFVVLIAMFAAIAAGGLVIVLAVIFPEVSRLELGALDRSLEWLIGLALIFVSGFALLPALILVLLTEAFGVRSLIAYALGGAAVGVCAYLAFVPFDSDSMRFAAIDHRELEVMTGAGILSGVVYWLIAGRAAGAWRASSG